MKVTRRSSLTGVEHTLEIDLDPTILEKWETGEIRYIQQAFPNLTASEREFLMTGITEDEWERLVPEDDCG